jgi:hypothetical protein
MGKSIENRSSLGKDFHAKISKPELKAAPYKPGLLALYDKYQSTVAKYGGTGSDSIVSKKKALAKYIDQVVTLHGQRNTANDAINTEMNSTWDKNAEATKKYKTQLLTLQGQADKADMAQAAEALKNFAAAEKTLLEADMGFMEKKITNNAKFVDELKKTSDTCDRESKAIDAATKQLTSSGDTLEAQMKSLLLANKKIAEQQKNKALADELGEALALLLQ